MTTIKSKIGMSVPEGLALWLAILCTCGLRYPIYRMREHFADRTTSPRSDKAAHRRKANQPVSPQMVATGKRSRMLSFIWPMRDGHLRVVSTTKASSMASSSYWLATGPRHADGGEIRMVAPGFPQRDAGFAADATQITTERFTSRVQGTAVRTVDLAHVAGVRVAVTDVALSGNVVCSAALQSVSSCRSVRAALAVVNHPHGVGLDQYRRAMHIPGVPVGTDG